MPRPALPASLLFPLLLAVAGPVSAQQQSRPAQAPDEAQNHEHGADDGSDYTLKQVMQHLAHALAEIDMGLLTNNRLMIREGAHAIANHPQPQGGIKPYITRNIVDLMPTIQKMDREVHQTARELAEAAVSAPMPELHEMKTRMTTGCISCHQVFRD